MQSVEHRDRLSVLVLLAASTSFGVLAVNLGGSAEQAELSTASSRLLLAASVAGSLLALLMLLSPGKNHRSLRTVLKTEWPRLTGLGVLVLGYAFSLEPLGFFAATSLFLGLGYLLLGERRIWQLLLTSVPVAALLDILIYGVFGIAIAHPLLRTLGIVA